MPGAGSPQRMALPGPSPLGPLGPLGPRSLSRTSLASGLPLPSISEDDSQLPTRPSQPVRPSQRRSVSLPILPPSHKRKPSQRAARLGPNGSGPGPAPLGPPVTRRSHYRPPSRTRGGQQPAFGLGTIYDGQFARTHSLYIPPHPPPDYYSHTTKGLNARPAEAGYRDSLRRLLAGKDLPDGAPPLKENYTAMEKIRESPWVARRGGWCRIILYLAIVIALIVGLSVGLALGLKHPNFPSSSDPSNPSEPSSTDTPASADDTPSFPAGSYAFETALANVSSSCSANAAAWRCPPYVTYADASPASDDAAASFFWTIAPPDPRAGQHGYVVSSAENPFAPGFANATMTLRDGNEPDERLEFEVSMNRTVVPDPSAFRPGVSCVFPTVLRGIVWTDRVPGGNRTRTIAPAAGEDAGQTWPGEIEVTETSTEGPRCTDASGAVVRAAAGIGECLCRYANYNLGGGAGSGGASSSTRRVRRRLSPQ